MIYKSYLVEQNENTLNTHKAFLFYGENQGLKKEFKIRLKKLNNKSQILNLFQEDLIKNQSLLRNEISNKSLFEESKVIFIHEATDKIIQPIEDVVDDLNNDKIYLFSDLLDKKSKLRNLFEKSKKSGIIACYTDNEITIKKLITQKLSRLKGFNQQILNLIIQAVGTDRDKINNEVEKIESCFKNSVLETSKIEQLLNLSSIDDFSLLKDAAIRGNKFSTNRLLADTVFESEKIFYYINLIVQRINKLREIEDIKGTNGNTQEIISKLKPPVFWKDKPILAEQSIKWNKKKIDHVLKMMFELENKIKTNSSIRNDLLIKNLLINLCDQANSA
tara:strand:+ start:597 stop:1595 length:999 start_codon:yes stop_codon:yes gene_type:complete